MLSPVDLSSLRPGTTLSRDLYSRHGARLAPAGARLTPALLATLRGFKGEVMYFTTGAPEMEAARLLQRTAEPVAGEQVRADVATIGGSIPVVRGETVEPHHADAFSFGAYIGDTEEESEHNRRRRMRVAEQLVSQRAERWRTLPLSVERDVDPLLSPEARLRGSVSETTPWFDDASLIRFREDRVERFRWLFARVIAGVRIDVAQPLRIVHELMDLQAACPASFARLATPTSRRADYLPDHAFTTCVLSIAVAARLGCGAADVRHAGLAGLLVDCGMTYVPERIRSAQRLLDEFEINRMRRHPAMSVALLEVVEGLPERVLRAVHQHHERLDGSGYPAGLRARSICDDARIVGVADAFAGASAPRPYRLVERRPYDAIAEVVRLGGGNVFDRVMVRALVEAVGLFPVGSNVLLSTGDRAVVIGANPRAMHRPVVRLLAGPDAAAFAGGRYALGDVIDLAEQTLLDVRILRAIDPPESFGAQRMAA
ncbi:MAG: HD domain-containing protein [Phycisphaerales bacterium]|nr:MAG: HD domain-containing protein [Phycisphaerales bacterium]